MTETLLTEPQFKLTVNAKLRLILFFSLTWLIMTEILLTKPQLKLTQCKIKALVKRINQQVFSSPEPKAHG